VIVVILAVVIFQDSTAPEDAEDLNLDTTTPTFKMNEVVADIDSAEAGKAGPAIPGEGTLLGIVMDEEGATISGATIRAVRTRSPEKPLILSEYTSFEAKAESDGRFVFLDLPAGTYALRATMNDTAGHAIAMVKDPAAGAKDRANDIEIIMKPAGKIAGSVKDPYGTPLKNILIMPLSLRASITKSDREGRFSIEGLPVGSHTIVTYSEDHYPESMPEVEINETKLEFILRSIDAVAEQGVPAAQPEAGMAAKEDAAAKEREAAKARRMRRPMLPPHDPRLRDPRMRNKRPPGFDPRQPGRRPPAEKEGDPPQEEPPKQGEEKK
jgi:hypothetical protein